MYWKNFKYISNVLNKLVTLKVIVKAVCWGQREESPLAISNITRIPVCLELLQKARRYL